MLIQIQVLRIRIILHADSDTDSDYDSPFDSDCPCVSDFPLDSEHISDSEHGSDLDSDSEYLPESSGSVRDELVGSRSRVSRGVAWRSSRVRNRGNP